MASTYPVPERIRSVAAPVAASLLLLVVACCLTWKAPGFSPSQLVDQCDREGESRDSAPIVVVGVLMSDTRVLGPVPGHSDRRSKLQLRKLQVKVENVLKGDATVGPAAVYYFTFAGGFDGPQPLGFWRAGGPAAFSGFEGTRASYARHATDGTVAPGACTAVLIPITQLIPGSRPTMPWLT